MNQHLDEVIQKTCTVGCDEKTTEPDIQGPQFYCMEEEVERFTKIRTGPSVADVPLNVIVDKLAESNIFLTPYSRVTWMPDGRTAGDVRLQYQQTPPSNTHPSTYELNTSGGYCCVQEYQEKRGIRYYEGITLAIHAPEITRAALTLGVLQSYICTDRAKKHPQKKLNFFGDSM